MIFIYTNKQDSEDWILQNDWYFNLYTGNEDFTQKDSEVIWQIDHAKLTENKHIETKYGLGTVRNLSTGCKTMLNVMKNPGKVVSADECGKNVLDMLFAMDGIHLYMSRPERIHIADDVKICFITCKPAQRKYVTEVAHNLHAEREIPINNMDVVTGRKGYELWWSKEYARRDADDL